MRPPKGDVTKLPKYWQRYIKWCEDEISEIKTSEHFVYDTEQQVDPDDVETFKNLVAVRVGPFRHIYVHRDIFKADFQEVSICASLSGAVRIETTNWLKFKSLASHKAEITT